MKLIKLKTTDGSEVWLNPHAVGAIEVVPGSTRSPGYLKIMVGGYHLNCELEVDVLIKMLNENTPQAN